MLQSMSVFPEVGVQVRQQPPWHNTDSQFFLNLPNNCLFRSFSKFDFAARKLPLTIQTMHARRSSHGQEHFAATRPHNTGATRITLACLLHDIYSRSRTR